MKTMTLEPEIVTRRGKPVAVILAVKAYERLPERLEDLRMPPR
jgi:prevent-host-death family protein